MEKCIWINVIYDNISKACLLVLFFTEVVLFLFTAVHLIDNLSLNGKFVIIINYYLLLEWLKKNTWLLIETRIFFNARTEDLRTTFIITFWLLLDALIVRYTFSALNRTIKHFSCFCNRRTQFPGCNVFLKIHLLKMQWPKFLHKKCFLNFCERFIECRQLNSSKQLKRDNRNMPFTCPILFVSINCWMLSPLNTWC